MPEDIPPQTAPPVALDQVVRRLAELEAKVRAIEENPKILKARNEVGRLARCHTENGCFIPMCYGGINYGKAGCYCK